MRPIMIAALVALCATGCKATCTVETPDAPAVRGVDYELLAADVQCQEWAAQNGLVLDETPIAPDGTVTCVGHRPACEECEMGQAVQGWTPPQAYYGEHMGTRGIQ